jgi:hypothetical protein
MEGVMFLGLAISATVITFHDCPPTPLVLGMYQSNPTVLTPLSGYMPFGVRFVIVDVFYKIYNVQDT